MWRWSYRHLGKQKLMTLGQYPDVSLALARDRHLDARRLLATDVDPMADRKAKKTAEQVASENSFDSVAAKWMEHWQVGKSRRHVETTKLRLNGNILPRLGPRPVSEIEAPEIVAMAKSIDARNAGDVARRALQTTGQIFRYAIANGYAKRNPVSDIPPRDILKATHITNFARVDAKELPTLLRKIETYQGTHLTRLAIKLMALTFVRTSELISAPWSEFDLEAARWDIPKERMKMNKPHIVPLSRQSVEILRTLRDLSGYSKWVFPGARSDKHTMSNNTILKGLERMGYKGRMTGHGFRGLASTILHERGYNSDHIEVQLAHLPRNTVSAAYNHAIYLKPRTQMLQEWADYLDQIQRGAKVLPFKEVVV
jgi:integrase